MKSRVSVTEVARHFSDYLNRVAYDGASFVLIRGNRAIAELCPLPAGRRLAELPELLAALPRLSETEARSFADDVAAARTELAQSEPSDRWDS